MKNHDNVVGFGDEDENVATNKNKKSGKKKISGGFSTMNLSFPVLKGIQKRGYKNPTPIQRKCIPLVLEGKDVVAMARTGSGKTAGFLVPMFEKLRERSPKSGARALILSPTRELSIQTLRFIKEIGKFTSLKSTVVLGGDSMDNQFSAIHGNPDIIVATPGRFLHLCVEMDLKLDAVEYVVFDEADRLFEMGFGEQLREIINRLPDARQTLLFSATLPKLLVEFAKAGLHDPVLLRLDVETKIPETLKLEFLSVRSEEKPASLLCLLNVLPNKSKTVVFAATKHHVEFLHALLDKAGIANTMIYSDLDPSARKLNSSKFATGNVNVLVVTDVAARGIDIPLLDYVINYHFPAKPKLFVHRVGRCARAGRSGTAFSFVAHDEYPYLLDLHLFLGRPLNLLSIDRNIASDTDGAVGKIPQSAVEEQLMEILKWQSSDTDLEAAKIVSSNSYKQYIRCRPGASVESVKRVKQLDFTNLKVHPIFGDEALSMENNSEFLEKMKKFKPNGTIFELNMSSKAESYSVMKATRKAHQGHVKRTREEHITEDNNDNSRSTLEASSSNDILETFNEIVSGKKRRSEYYVPRVAPDHHTEAGLTVNSFTNDVHNAGFDMTNDTSEGILLQKKLLKWEMSKKRRAIEEGKKVKKIRTESGVLIPATYKSKRYEQWKEKSKIGDIEEESDDDEGDGAKKTLKTFPHTHWGRHNKKVAEQLKVKSDIKRPDQILKYRLKKEKRNNINKLKKDRGKKKKSYKH